VQVIEAVSAITFLCYLWYSALTSGWIFSLMFN